MRLLLDTHALIWWFLDNQRLSATARSLLDDPEAAMLISAATAWEMATKLRNGRLQEAEPLVRNLPSLVAQWHFTPLPITLEHGRRAGSLAGQHRDPFDRMLAAQALIEDVSILTIDSALAELGARIVW